MATRTPRPSESDLVRCAAVYADALCVRPIPEAQAREVIERVLFSEDHGWEACEMGIITREELVFLVMAHLHTELTRDELGDQSQVEAPAAIQAVRLALFGMATDRG